MRHFANGEGAELVRDVSFIQSQESVGDTTRSNRLSLINNI